MTRLGYITRAVNSKINLRQLANKQVCILSSRLLHIDCSVRESKDAVSTEYLLYHKFAPVLYLEATYLCIIKYQNRSGNIIFLCV